MKLPEVEKLLYDDSSEMLEVMAQRACDLTRQRFGRVIQLFAPVYISNECIDTCSYCAFSRPNQIQRRTLTAAEVEQEAGFLIAQGFRHLLLVAGEHPRAVSLDYLQGIARRLRPQLASLSIEVAPFDESGYRLLTTAGIDGVVIYQETYNRERYLEVHQAGPKRDYDKRLQAPARAAAGGARRIGMGILLGLSDWRQDALNLIDHVRSLQKKFWQVEFQISLPRLRPCFGGLTDVHEVRDRDMVRLICALRLALPEVGIVLSTRESPQFRDHVMLLGVTQMSAGSRTEPGGYREPQLAEEQFSIGDHRSAQEVAGVIAQHNLDAVWKDWEASLYG